MTVHLWNYEAALLEMERFREANSLVLDTWELMQGRLREVEEALKAFARENGPEEDERFIVTVTPKTRRWYDADTVLKMAPHVAQMPGVMELNRERVNQLAKAKAFDAAVIKAAYREEALTPAVKITRKHRQDEVYSLGEAATGLGLRD